MHYDFKIQYILFIIYMYLFIFFCVEKFEHVSEPYVKSKVKVIVAEEIKQKHCIFMMFAHQDFIAYKLSKTYISNCVHIKYYMYFSLESRNLNFNQLINRN